MFADTFAFAGRGNLHFRLCRREIAPHLPRGFSLCGAFAAGLKAVAGTQGNPIPTEARFQEAKGGMNIRPASLQKPRRGATNGAQKNKKTGK